MVWSTNLYCWRASSHSPSYGFGPELLIKASAAMARQITPASPAAAWQSSKHPLYLGMKISDAVFEGAELDFIEKSAVEAALAQFGGLEILAGEGHAVE